MLSGMELVLGASGAAALGLYLYGRSVSVGDVTYVAPPVSTSPPVASDDPMVYRVWPGR